MAQGGRLKSGQDTIRSKLKAERIQGALTQRRSHPPLMPEDLQAKLAGAPGWHASADGSSLQRTYELPSIRAAGLLVQLLLEVGEATGYVPEVDVRHLEVSVTVSTSTAPGVTELELDVVRVLDLRL